MLIADGVTAEVHLVSPSRPKIAFESHYVGDIRAINAEVLDAYQLKSLDAFIDVDLAGTGGARGGGLQMYFEKRQDGKIFVKFRPAQENSDPSIAAYDKKPNGADDRRRQPEYELFVTASDVKVKCRNNLSA